MTVITFIRHAQGTHNADALVRGVIAYADPIHTDAALTEFGYQQARAVRPKMEAMSFDAIYCSPLRRCRQTLLEILPASADRTVYLDDALIEQSPGPNCCDTRVDRIEGLPSLWNTDAGAPVAPEQVCGVELRTKQIRGFLDSVCLKWPMGHVLVVGHSQWILNWCTLIASSSDLGMPVVHLANCETLTVEL